MKAINNQEEYKLDFDDALVLACMEKLQIIDLVTFDNDFNDISSIQVISPLKGLEKLKDLIKK